MIYYSINYLTYFPLPPFRGLRIASNDAQNRVTSDAMMLENANWIRKCEVVGLFCLSEKLKR